MNKDEALRLALEALQSGDYWKGVEAVNAIKQALKQPEPEPVALWQLVEQALKGDLCADSDEDLALILNARKELAEIKSPQRAEGEAPKRKPLTDEREAFKQYIHECDRCAIAPDAAGAFHAAWQAAHGIKGEA